MDPDELDALLRKIHAVYLGAIAYRVVQPAGFDARNEMG